MSDVSLMECEKFVVLEGGASVGAHVSAWAHVQSLG
jgi:hypothetical protein